MTYHLATMHALQTDNIQQTSYRRPKKNPIGFIGQTHLEDPSEEDPFPDIRPQTSA